jgi:hypothetical protein
MNRAAAATGCISAKVKLDRKVQLWKKWVGSLTVILKQF